MTEQKSARSGQNTLLEAFDIECEKFRQQAIEAAKTPKHTANLFLKFISKLLELQRQRKMNLGDMNPPENEKSRDYIGVATRNRYSQREMDFDSHQAVSQ